MGDFSELTRTLLTGLATVEHELFVFAAFWFVLGTLDELGVDLVWIWLRLTGRAQAGVLAPGLTTAPLQGCAAVLVPAWREASVIGQTIEHALAAWVQRDWTMYVGCYRNDAETIVAAMRAAGGDPRIRVVIHDRAGPTTKADCLNRLYAALDHDEARRGFTHRAVLLHDAEDMVHPAELAAIDRALGEVDFVQLPVRPEPQRASRWIAGHYADEFAESHGKAMVVRDALNAGIPAAGVGCGFARDALTRLAVQRMSEGEAGPFSADCLTEDYELGLMLSGAGRGGRFLRLRDEAGALVATRSFFPADMRSAVQQKTRWMHGIALQSWERLGWGDRALDVWMALRDRRGPLTSLVLAVAYALLIVESAIIVATWFGIETPVQRPPLLTVLLWISGFGLVWRMAMRFAFTASEYGTGEGIRAVLRIPIGNIVAIIAGRRAFTAYVRGLFGATPVWEKTTHIGHPAQLATVGNRP